MPSIALNSLCGQSGWLRQRRRLLFFRIYVVFISLSYEGIPLTPNADGRHAMRSPSALRDVKLFRDACKHASQSEAMRRPRSEAITSEALHFFEAQDLWHAFNRTKLSLRAIRMAPPTAATAFFSHLRGIYKSIIRGREL